MGAPTNHPTGPQTDWPGGLGDQWPGIVAEPTDTGWRGRPVATDAHPEHLGPVLCDAARGHFHHDVAALRRHLLHDHHGWYRLGGDFLQPAGYVPRNHQPTGTNTDSPEWTRFQGRNQCLCHDQRLAADTWIHDAATGHPADYAYVLGDQALTVQVYGRPQQGPPSGKTPWWTVATVDWEEPWATGRWEALTYHKPTYP